jgi:hypothetical protein
VVRLAAGRSRCQSASGGWSDGAGNLSNIEWFRGIGEYKIDWGPGLRIYLAKDGLKIIILIGGGTKKRQQQDIDQAVALWETYKRRKASTRQGK